MWQNLFLKEILECSKKKLGAIEQYLKFEWKKP